MPLSPGDVVLGVLSDLPSAEKEHQVKHDGLEAHGDSFEHLRKEARAGGYSHFVRVSFFEGRTSQAQAAFGDALSATGMGLPALDIMKDHFGELVESVGDKWCTTPRDERPMGYYMLCDDEELGISEDGAVDGDLKIRKSCISWELVALGQITNAVIAFSGTRADGTRVGRVVLRTVAPHTEVVEKTTLARIPEDEAGWVIESGWSEGTPELREIVLTLVGDRTEPSPA